MKKIITLAFFIFSSFLLTAQTDGISYQAVILGPNTQELPGADAVGNILPNTQISIRFTIINSNNTQEYQEVQTTSTDVSGRINLIIGKADPDAFTLISWNGEPKDLKVEIDFSGSGGNFVDMSRQELTFVPYAYHRNITAAGTLIVDDATTLNSELLVEGPTNLNSSLSVNNENDTNLSGLLNVEGNTGLKSNLNVDGITNLYNSLNVENHTKTYLSGDLIVGDSTYSPIGSALFNGPTAFKGNSEFTNLSVNGSAYIRGITTIDSTTTINAATTINGITTINNQSALNGQVKINFDTTGANTDLNAYPLIVEGSQQGVVIKVNGIKSEPFGLDVDPIAVSNANNFITFMDENGKSWGRIEGKSLTNLFEDPNFHYETASLAVNTALAGADLAIAGFEVVQGVVQVTAASSSSTACAGVGACITAPIPSLIVSEGANLVLKIANVVVAGVNLSLVIADDVAFVANSTSHIGVSYQSGAADYAEWLPKLNPSDIFLEGDIVGVTNGFITKNTFGAEKVMVISTNPIVLGNMPQQNNEANYEKVAFMGQVPVKVLGSVTAGDYILPSIIGGSYGRAIHPDDMELTDYKKIVGVAWSVISKIANNINLVNVAVGLNTNDLITIVSEQEEEINNLKLEYDELKNQINSTNNILAELVPGYADATGIEIESTESHTTKHSTINEKEEAVENNFVSSTEDDIVFFEVSREQVETCIQVARDNYQQTLDDKAQMSNLFINQNNTHNNSKTANSDVLEKTTSQFYTSIENHPFWSRLDSDSAYKEEVIQYIKSSLEKSFHTHKKYQNQFIDLNIKE
ncbi:hypothetical protein SAMN05444411_102308 [Lutibacter oricola]|uniref:Peptidase S74 domain-containing protein n=1 Tax=Lutibacter oricola TaxID=762486 RepID=A0A1H2WWZ2_9FLAO|nr:hypothetical protein [Lutibacter oricola]SDW85091.1 hypothetical protein SAMN05444411_102308 [Lutibacter oricola]